MLHTGNKGYTEFDRNIDFGFYPSLGRAGKSSLRPAWYIIIVIIDTCLVHHDHHHHHHHHHYFNRHHHHHHHHYHQSTKPPSTPSTSIKPPSSSHQVLRSRRNNAGRLYRLTRRFRVGEVHQNHRPQWSTSRWQEPSWCSYQKNWRKKSHWHWCWWILSCWQDGSMRIAAICGLGVDYLCMIKSGCIFGAFSERGKMTKRYLLESAEEKSLFSGSIFFRHCFLLDLFSGFLVFVLVFFCNRTKTI